MSEAGYSAEQYIRSLERTGRVVEPAIRRAIRALGIEQGRGLDVPCGIGTHSVWMAGEFPGLQVEGADFAAEHIDYAKNLAGEKGLSKRLTFVEADMNKLEYADDSFDFIWCCDGLWPGPPEVGCIAEKPYDILDNFKRIVKPGGTIAVLYWSGHRLLPGYPLVESALNACSSANVPMTPDSPPELHIMNTLSWLRETGLTDIKSRTFVADIIGPIGPEIREAFHGFTGMMWYSAGEELSPELLGKYREITDPTSDSYIFMQPDYNGFITYTMFSGIVPAA